MQAEEKQTVLQQTLNDFGVEAQVLGFMTGPVITLFELSLAAGVKVSQISNLAADIARALAVPGVRVVSPLPGRDTIGIEVPNLDKEIVRIKELMQSAPEADGEMYLPTWARTPEETRSSPTWRECRTCLSPEPPVREKASVSMPP